MDLPICTACGTQYSSTDFQSSETQNPPPRCKICDDPRQFIPSAGQSWTTLTKLRSSHNNTWKQDPHDPRIWSIRTEPHFAIGQRCFLLKTVSGNVLWDCIALLDDATVEFIKAQGGIKAIVISHPHFWTTHLEWAKAFGCPVYISKADEDAGWLCRIPTGLEKDISKRIEKNGKVEVLEGVRTINAGGHFEGSMVLSWESYLFVADTIVTVPSAYTPHPRPANQTTYAFMWSIPNMIPLSRDAILRIWHTLKELNFDTTFGIFEGMEVRDNAKERLKESVKAVLNTGYKAEGGDKGMD